MLRVVLSVSSLADSLVNVVSSRFPSSLPVFLLFPGVVIGVFLGVLVSAKLTLLPALVIRLFELFASVCFFFELSFFLLWVVLLGVVRSNSLSCSELSESLHTVDPGE